MFRFLCKSMFCSSTRNLQVLKLYSTSLKKAEKSSLVQNGNQESFTVQYLMNQFGFSKQKAVVASSKYVNFDKPDKPDSVISFFKNQGFTESQIKKVVSIYPVILSSDPQTTLLPKIQFFRYRGFLAKDLATIFLVEPSYFKRSLENCIEPSFNFIQDFLGSEKYAILAISSCPRLLLQLEPRVKPNIEILLGVGMSQSAIAHLLRKRPMVFAYTSEKLRECVEQVQNMGMDPRNYNYGFALEALTTTRRSVWDKKIEAYKRWGCSEEDVLRSFKISSKVMVISEERLNGIMSFFVDEIGWEASEVVRRYFMFTLSLNKRMIPRWSVYKELLSKGLIKKDAYVSTMFRIKEDQFLEKFVNCHKNDAPLLKKLYDEKQTSK